MTRSALAIFVAAALFLSPRPAAGAFEVVWPDAASAGRGRITCATPTLLLVSERSAFDVAPIRGEGVGSGDRQAPPDGRSTRAGLREAAEWSVGLSFGELYGAPECRGARVALRRTSRARALRVCLATFGTDIYTESVFSCAGSFALGTCTAAGIEARVLSVSSAAGAGPWCVAVDAGLERRVAGRVALAASCRNMLDAELGASPVGSSTRLSALLDLDGIDLDVTVEAEPPFEPCYTFGVECELTPWLTARAGAVSNTEVLAAGIGLWPAHSTGVSLIDIAWQWHPRLGGSAFATINARF